MQRQGKLTGFMALVLFLLFSLCVLGVLLTGADVYQRITQRDSAAYDRRTAVQYLTTKLRQSDETENLAVVDFEGIPALRLREQIGDRCYQTHIYCMDGYIWELYAREGSGLSPEDGAKVLPAESMQLQWEAPVLTVNIGFADGTQRQAVLTLRSEGERFS